MRTAPREGDISFACRVLRHRTDLLLRELSALKQRANEEAVHDTRVQSRRLRAALDAFRDLVKPANWNSAYASIRKITKMLGRPRETGVILSLVNELCGTDDLACNLCREYLAERFRRKLKRQERSLRNALGTIDTKYVKNKMEPLFLELRQCTAKPGGAGISLQPATGDTRLPRARKVLEEFAEPILIFKPSRPFRKTKDARLHELRISAKKLRYAMEIFDEIWPDGLKGRIALAKGLQDAGGVFQDWCILCDKLKTRAKRLEKQRSQHLAVQVGSLLACAKQRKAELKEMILPSLIQLQTSLRTLPSVLREPGRPNKPLTGSGNKR